MNVFINPEVRKSSSLIVIITVTFIIIVQIILNISFNAIKIDYMEGKAALIGGLAEKYPEIESEIVNTVYKGSSPELIEKGKNISSQYGYGENLQISFLKSFNKSFIFVNRSIIILIIAFSLSFIGLNYYQYTIIYKRVRSLSKASKEILEGNYNIDIYEEKEGDFAKLAYGFKNMRSIIKNQMVELKSEKQFLVNILSDISHQLKTPLSALIVYNDILSKDDIKKEDKDRFVTNSRNQLTRMEWLIKSLLKLAKVDADAIEYNKKENLLFETVNDSIQTVGVMAKRNNVEINYNSDGCENIICTYDDLWLQEAIINILKNSIEHSPHGKICIYIKDSPINCKIIIKDNGEGISEEDLPNIFKRFYKSSKSDSVGIGLSLSKAIVEAQGGYIEVNSTKNVGTEFRVVILK